MKKLSMLSILIVIIAIAAMAFTFTDYTNQKPAYSELTFQISGCPGGDCSNLSYCLDGGSPIFVGSCNFSLQVTDGTHEFCIKCNKNAVGGLVKVTCNAVDMFVPVDMTSLKKCECGDTKKK
jgi:hypothetical protein